MRRALKTVVATAVLTMIAGVGILPLTPAQAAAGVPEDPTVLFSENFQNGSSPAPGLLTDYVGAGGQQYTAAAGWVDPVRCNGIVTRSTNTAHPSCTANDADLKNLAVALGTVNGSADPASNFAVSAFTAGSNLASNQIEFATATPLDVDVQNRFITFSVNAAATNCFSTHPQLKFFLSDGVNEIPATGSAIDPCTDPRATSTVVGGQTISAGTFASDSSTLFTGTSLGIVMRNLNGGAGGNDHAYDDIKVLDVTPTLDKAFAAPAGADPWTVGQSVPLTFTITNTSEKAEKTGWSFTDALTSGLAVAAVPNVSSTCAAGTVSAAAGATSVGVSAGSIAAGEASCTVTVDVVADHAGAFDNGPANVTTTGLVAPKKTTLTAGPRAATPKPLIACTPAEVRATQRNWFFGNQAGLDFGVSGNAAPTPTAPTGLNSAEGTTVVTDTGGNLLFLADGSQLRNRNQQPMLNGTGLTGNPSSTQTVAAFPALNRPGIYFVVTTNGAEGNNGQLRYSEVDMTLDGGLGGVTATKNVDLGGLSSSEGLTAVPNADGTGFWVLTFSYSSPNVLAYLFDGNGPVTGVPVVSVMPTNNRNQYGSFNLSADLGQLLMTTNQSTGASTVRLLDLDAATGEMVETMEWNGPVGPGVGNNQYTADFSPSGKYVYLTKIFGTATLHRYTLDGNVTGAAVQASEVKVGNLLGSGGQVKRGPDGRMYVAQVNNPLAVVNAPDATDPADVDFVNNGQSLGAGVSRFGLPQMATGCPVAPAPELKVTKHADLDDTNDNGFADVGEEITYTFDVENTGNVALTDVTVDDPRVTGISPASVATLAVGAAPVTFTADAYTVTQADIDAGGVANTATGSGTPPTGPAVTSPPSKVTTPAPPRAPAMTIKKSSVFTDDVNDDGKADKGDKLTYSFLVKNTGNVTITGVSIVDPKVTGITPAAVTLAPGASQTFTSAAYTVTQGDVDSGEVVNSATASGTSPTGSISSPPSVNKVPGPTPDASVDVVKAGTITTDNGAAGKADKGDVITYTFTVHNGGPATAHNVSVADGLAGLSAITPAAVATLAPGADAVFTATYTVTQADVDHGSVLNQATANFRPPTPPGGAVPPLRPSPPSNQVTIDAPDPDPALTIDKSSSFADDVNADGKADKGDKLSYSFLVKNTGNVTMTGVTVDDPKVTGITPAAVTLAPGASQTFTAAVYTVTQADVDAGGAYNSATGAGTAPGGAKITSPEDENVVPGPTPDAVVSVEKAAALTTDKGVAGKADAGDVITYTFTVHNGGPATALDVTVKDALPGLSPVAPASVASLAPGADAVFTATYTVLQADVNRGSVENQATAEFRPPTPHGGAVPPVRATPPSNNTKVPAGPKNQPSVSTRSSTAKVVAKVRADGRIAKVSLHDRVTIRGIKAGGGAVGTATLYGPTSRVAASTCTPGRAVRTVKFTARNGTFDTPTVQVAKPGHYTWVVKVPEDFVNKGYSHACGLAAESTLVQRPSYGPVTIATGYTIDPSGARTAAAGAGTLRYDALGITAGVQVAGVSGGAMKVPANTARLGLLNRSAGVGEAIGTTILAGHVSDRRDRPGAFWKLSKARTGQIVTVRDAAGVLHRYRVVSTATYLRSKKLPTSLFSTTGAPRLALVSCTGKVKHSDGTFHYTRNQVVIAVPIG